MCRHLWVDTLLAETIQPRVRRIRLFGRLQWGGRAGGWAMGDELEQTRMVHPASTTNSIALSR